MEINWEGLSYYYAIVGLMTLCLIGSNNVLIRLVGNVLTIMWLADIFYILWTITHGR